MNFHPSLLFLLLQSLSLIANLQAASAFPLSDPIPCAFRESVSAFFLPGGCQSVPAAADSYRQRSCLPVPGHTARLTADALPARYPLPSLPPAALPACLPAEAQFRADAASAVPPFPAIVPLIRLFLALLPPAKLPASPVSSFPILPGFLQMS